MTTTILAPADMDSALAQREKLAELMHEHELVYEIDLLNHKLLDAWANRGTKPQIIVNVEYIPMRSLHEIAAKYREHGWNCRYRWWLHDLVFELKGATK